METRPLKYEDEDERHDLSFYVYAIKQRASDSVELYSIKEKMIYNFDNYDEALSFLKEKEPLAGLALNRTADGGYIAHGGLKYVVAPGGLRWAKKIQSCIDELPPELKELVEKYETKYNFGYFFEKPEEYGTFMVYVYYTLEGEHPFFVDYKQDEYEVYDSQIPRVKLKKLQKKYTIEYKIIAKGLRQYNAEIVKRMLMLYYTDQGEFIIGQTALNYRKSGKSKFKYSEFDFEKVFFPEEINHTDI